MRRLITILAIMPWITGAATAIAPDSAAATYNVRQYGAAGDGETLDTQAIQKAVDACAAGGGGMVYFPAGRYKAGTLLLRSHIMIYLDAGAVLAQSRDMGDYIEVAQDSYTRITGSRYVFLHGVRVEQVSIAGAGIIDGNLALDRGGRGPLSILFEHCRDIRIEDVTVANSPGWSVTFFGCKRVDIIRVKCLDSYADGINPTCCQNVLYDGVLIEGSGDDAITIKNEGFDTNRPDWGFLSRNIVNGVST